MIVVDCEQGTPEWHRERAGVITASMAAEVLKTGRSKADEWSQGALDYAFRLAAERITDLPLEETPETWAMKRGKEMEPQARDLHAFTLGQPINECGMVKTDCGRFGASPDGLIGDDGGSEYKCFTDPAKLRRIIGDQDIAPYIPQCDMALWITGRQWWDFCLYCPALESAGRDLTRYRINRDEERIEDMAKRLEAFDCVVEGYRKTLTNEVAA